MRWTVATVCSMAVIAGSGLAAAQPAPANPPPAAVAPAAAAAPTADPRSDAGWQLYHDAFAALMQGEASRARDLASALLRDYPDHPATRLVRDAHLCLAPGAVDEHAAAAANPETVEAPSNGARAELALFQSLHGLALGIELCVALDCRSGEAILGAALAGSGVGAVVSVRLDVTPGQRALLDSGTAWGAANAGLVLIATNNDHDGQTISAGLIGGQIAGLAGGAALIALHPTAGQVALANSGGIWTGILGVMIYDASGASLDQHARAAGSLIAIDAGIAAGGYLASRWPAISRAQTLVIDASGLAGAVGGGALGVLIAGQASDRLTPALAAVGAVAGLGAAAYLTRDWHAGESSVQAYLAPPTHGRGGVAGIGFPW